MKVAAIIIAALTLAGAALAGKNSNAVRIAPDQTLEWGHEVSFLVDLQYTLWTLGVYCDHQDGTWIGGGDWEQYGWTGPDVAHPVVVRLGEDRYGLSVPWVRGPASCVAKLSTTRYGATLYRGWRVYAEVAFDAAGPPDVDP